MLPLEPALGMLIAASFIRHRIAVEEISYFHVKAIQGYGGHRGSSLIEPCAAFAQDECFSDPLDPGHLHGGRGKLSARPLSGKRRDNSERLRFSLRNRNRCLRVQKDHGMSVAAISRTPVPTFVGLVNRLIFIQGRQQSPRCRQPACLKAIKILEAGYSIAGSS